MDSLRGEKRLKDGPNGYILQYVFEVHFEYVTTLNDARAANEDFARQNRGRQRPVSPCRLPQRRSWGPT